MARLEELTPGAAVQGIVPNAAVTVESVKWHGSAVVEVIYKDAAGRPSIELLYRDREPTLTVVAAGRTWSFDADGALLRLASEAYRIRLAHLFDPLLAVHTSNVDPLPHQITAVYGEMLPRQPLRFLLADDPGAGKTIMAGLLIKELLLRGDLRRCLICCPGSLVDQWQDELDRRFGLPFDIITRETVEASRTGNPFIERDHILVRLDHMSRNEELQAKLEQTDWDLVIVDEAHKMSATYFGGEVSYTKRYHFGQLLSSLTRHFLLMTATPHNGKEEDFQLFMALLDGDRFEGKPRDGARTADISDLMRRLVKEQLYKFDGTHLFPERIAYTVAYRLSDAEAALYKEVTDYVRDEFNRADALENEGRKGTVGFALMILQRRLASSPEAIHQSLRRRRERLEKRLREEQLLKRGAEVRIDAFAGLRILSEDDLDEFEDLPGAEVEEAEEGVVDRATAAQTIREFEAEIDILRRLEALALEVKRSMRDSKWEKLSELFQNESAMFDAQGHHRKLVIFTEHRDTLNYLTDRIRTLIGRDDAVVTIHGGMGRGERRTAQERFTQDKGVQVLVATDAAGEGINLQRAHLMVNYDLPWNPNRLEQRFGRIHRIGQTEVCHLWNLVSEGTREGEVFHTLFTKLEVERAALGGQVFDVLGKVTFGDRPLRELLVEAIRYGDRAEVRRRLTEVVEGALDKERLQRLLDEDMLARDSMDASKIQQLRAEMERAEAQRLQPHYIAEFFLEAFKRLGGSVREREASRYEITHVPAIIRSRDRQVGTGEAVLTRYERITFEKELVSVPGKPLAAFVCPGHPLLDATIDLVLERHWELLKRGAVLIDPDDAGEEPRTLFYLEHAIQDRRLDRDGNRRVISRRLQFVEIEGAGVARAAGGAPYLDYRPATEEEQALLVPALASVPRGDEAESQALSYAIAELVPRHLTDVRREKEPLIDKTWAAVKARLTREINHWDHRAEQLKLQEQAGRTPRLNSARARQRADELQVRLERRKMELEQERQLAAAPPVVVGGALIVPAGLLARLGSGGDGRRDDFDTTARERARIERLAMDAVMAAERRLGYEPRDVSADKCGYDVESLRPDGGPLRFIEVKGRARGADTVTVTKNEILTALNKPDQFILAIVEVDGTAASPRYVRVPFKREPDFGVTSVNYALRDLLARGEEPA